MSSPSVLEVGDNVRLTDHPTARNQAVASNEISAGSLILSIPCYTCVLLPEEKGRRCDTCHRQEFGALRKCSGCACYWYCDKICQSMDWNLQHRRICKTFNAYTASQSYQAMAAHEKMDALLLSHMVARVSMESKIGGLSATVLTFLSLLPGPMKTTVPPYGGQRASEVPDQVVSGFFARFANNNFVIHSHLNTFGHGIFPLASRLFNHSCVPNAAVKYIISQSRAVEMHVVALSDIASGEQICIPYLDPALLQTRQQIFQSTYGFTCECSSCKALENFGPINSSAVDSGLEESLHEYLTSRPETYGFWNDTGFLPAFLRPVLTEEYLQKTSAEFSSASHDGSYVKALRTGSHLLDLYRLIYPRNYPQIGLHLLELAKSAWNKYVSSRENDAHTLETVRHYVTSAHGILAVYGSEGDVGGPLKEIEALDGLLDGQSLS